MQALIRLEGKLMAIEFERCQQWNDKNGKEYLMLNVGRKRYFFKFTDNIDKLPMIMRKVENAIALSVRNPLILTSIETLTEDDVREVGYRYEYSK